MNNKDIPELSVVAAAAAAVLLLSVASCLHVVLVRSRHCAFFVDLALSIVVQASKEKK